MVGRALFVLANYNSCMHTTIEVRVSSSPTQSLCYFPHALLEAQNAPFAEEMSLLNALGMHSNFTIYEQPIGGKSPKETDDSIIAEI